MGGLLGKSLYVDKHRDTALVSTLTLGGLGALGWVAADPSRRVAASAMMAAQLGMQVWVGLVAGPTMFHNMERQVS